MHDTMPVDEITQLAVLQKSLCDEATSLLYRAKSGCQKLSLDSVIDAKLLYSLGFHLRWSSVQVYFGAKRKK